MLGRGHAEGFVLGGDAGEEFAVIGATGENGRRTGFELEVRAEFGVESETGFAVFFVGAVAGETVFAEDGEDVALEGVGGSHRFGSPGCGGEQTAQEAKRPKAAGGGRLHGWFARWEEAVGSMPCGFFIVSCGERGRNPDFVVRGGFGLDSIRRGSRSTRSFPAVLPAAGFSVKVEAVRLSAL